MAPSHSPHSVIAREPFTCEAVDWRKIHELVVIHHANCRFQSDDRSLRREWLKLAPTGPVHLWTLESERNRVRIYQPDSDRFFTPYELAHGASGRRSSCVRS